VFNSVLKVER